jgi:hypothetical protein
VVFFSTTPPGQNVVKYGGAMATAPHLYYNGYEIKSALKLFCLAQTISLFSLHALEKKTRDYSLRIFISDVDFDKNI